MHPSTSTQTQDHLSEMEARFKQLQSETISDPGAICFRIINPGVLIYIFPIR